MSIAKIGKEMNSKNNIKPISIWFTLILFGIPGLVLYYGTFYGAPLLISKGVPQIISIMSFTWVTTILLIPLSLILYKHEGNEMSLRAFKNRFRLNPIPGKLWFLVIGALIVCLISDLSLDGIGRWLGRIHFFAPPDYLPVPFNPFLEINLPFKEFLGVQLKGNWGILFVFVPLHITAMLGEELMWRGYILPRQEVKFGKWAWLINGLFWAYILHACLKWQFIGMLPSMLLTPWIAQKCRSTWASAFVHILGNSPIWILILLGILGVGS